MSTPPTTSDIKNQIIAQLETDLNQTIPLLPKAFNRVLAYVLAAVFVLLWKYADSIFLNLFADTAAIKETTIRGKTFIPLEVIGVSYGLGTRTAATRAELEIELTVLNPIGSIPTGTAVLNPNSGVTYTTVGVTSLTAPTVYATVRASGDQTGDGTGAGSIGNADVGTVLSFVQPQANVASDVVVSSVLVTGADAEDWEVYRQRVKDRVAKTPQGGAYVDYEIWGEATAGIINVYPYTGGTYVGSGPGQIDLYSEATPESSGSADGIPTAAQLTAVKDAVLLDVSGRSTQSPVNAFINSYPITRSAYDVEVSGLTGDNLAAVKTDIETAIDEYFVDREPYIPGLSVGPRKDQITRTALSGIVQDIVEAAGAVFVAVYLYKAALAIDIDILAEGEKAKTGTVTYP